MSTKIEEGEALVHGRGRETAKSLLAAAEDLGYEPSVVRTVFEGYVVPADVAIAAGEEAPEGDEPEGDEPDDDTEVAPAKSASKADWAAWAVGESARREEDPLLDAEAADALTKDVLIERYGAKE